MYEVLCGAREKDDVGYCKNQIHKCWQPFNFSHNSTTEYLQTFMHVKLFQITQVEPKSRSLTIKF